MTDFVSHETSIKDAAKPYFIPAGIEWASFPEEVKAAILAIVNPTYEELVLKATDGLERSTGMSVTYLLWLEVLTQLELTTKLSKPDSTFQMTRDQHEQIGRHLRLVNAKVKASSFIQRVKEFRSRHRPGSLQEATPTNVASNSLAAANVGGVTADAGGEDEETQNC